MRRRRDADEESEKKPSLVASGAAGLVGLAAGSYLTNQVLALKYQQQPYRNPYQQPYQIPNPYQQPYQSPNPYQQPYQSPYAQPAYNHYQQQATFPAYVSAPGNTVRYPSSSYGVGGSQTFSTSYYPSSYSYPSASYGRELQTVSDGNRQYQASDGVRLWLVSYNQNQSQGTRKPQSQSNNVFTGLLTNGYVSYFPDGNRNGVRLTKRK